MASPIQFGIVGCGAISNAHVRSLRGLSGLAELAAVADIQLDRAEKIAAETGCQPFASVDAMLEGAGIDAICVCTPPNVHADVAVQAMRAGKHVIIEKPADVSVAATDRIIEAAKQTGRKATIIAQHRFDVSALVVRRAVEQNRLGRLTRGAAQVRWWRPQPYFDTVPWRGSMAVSGGGALISQSIHTIDLMLWTMGPVEEVFAYEGVLAHERLEIEDTLVAVLKFKSGALGVLEASITAYPGLSARIEVSGDRGSAIIDSDVLEYFHTAEPGEETGLYGAFGDSNRAAKELEAVSPELKAYSHAPNFGTRKELRQAPGGAVATLAPEGGRGTACHPEGASATEGSLPQPTAAPLQVTSAHQEQIRDFAEAIRDDRPPAVSLEDARYVLEVIFAIHESARSGRPVRP